MQYYGEAIFVIIIPLRSVHVLPIDSALMKRANGGWKFLTAGSLRVFLAQWN